MKLLNSKEILIEVKKVSQKIKEHQIDASDSLKKALDTFSHMNEKDVEQEIAFIKKYNPEVYTEYIELVKRDTLSKKAEKLEKDSKVTSSLEQINNDGAFVEKYKRDKKIATLLNQQYYGSDEGGFWKGFNSAYDEGNIVFANSTWESKIFTFDGDSLSDAGKNYYEINRCGDFYIGVQVQTTKEGNSQRLVEGSHTYVVLDTQGHEIKNLRGHLHQRPSDGIYVETYTQGDKEMRAYYDEHMNMIIDAIELKNQLLFFDDGKCLFENFDSGEKGKFVAEQGKSWDGKYISEEEIKNEDIYKKYKADIAFQQERNKAEQEEKNKTSHTYDIEFDDKAYVRAIMNKNGNLVYRFNDGYNYSFQYPNLHKSDYLAHAGSINKGIFVMSGTDENGKYKRDIFINANNGVILKFDTHPNGTFVDNQVMKHYITSYTAELYNLSGQKLGKQLATDHDDDNYKTITNEDGKKQLVECRTGTVKEQKFDEELKRYDEKEEVVVVVKDGDAIVELYIKK